MLQRNGAVVGIIVAVDAVWNGLSCQRHQNILKQFRLLPDGKRIVEFSMPAFIESMIYPQIHLMRLVERVLPLVLPLLVIIKSVGVANPQIRLLQRQMIGNRRRHLRAEGAGIGTAGFVIVIVKTAQRS